MNRGTPGLPVHHQLPEFTQTHVHQVGDAIQRSRLLSSSRAGRTEGQTDMDGWVEGSLPQLEVFIQKAAEGWPCCSLHVPPTPRHPHTETREARAPDSGQPECLPGQTLCGGAGRKPRAEAALSPLALCAATALRSSPPGLRGPHRGPVPLAGWAALTVCTPSSAPPAPPQANPALLL